MKTLVKKFARRARTIPGIGRIVRIAAAVARLPELRAEVIALTSGMYEHDPKAAQPALWRAVNELRENTAGDANLTRSVPVALRRLTREVHALRQRLDTAGIPSGAQHDADQDARQDAPLLFVAPQGAASRGLRVYLGHGEPAPAGWIAASLDGAGGALPLAPGAAEEIQVAYVFETFAQAELRRHVLPQLHACLQPGGRLRVLAADAGAALAAYAAGRCGYDELRETLYGAPERDGRLRLNMLSPASLAALLDEAGFAVASASDTGMRDGRGHSFDIAAGKPLPAQETY